jgi:hypothetical protein
MRNWRTTIMGLCGALVLAWQPIVETYAGGPIEWRRLALSGFLAGLGYFARDRA